MRISQLKIFALISFMFASQTALLSYVSSNFLSEKGLSDSTLGLIYSLGAAFAIIVLLLIPKIFEKYGNKKTLLGAIVIKIFILLALFFSTNTLSLSIFFIIYISMLTINYYILDIHNEHYTKNKATGSVRAFYLTVGSLSWVIFPSLGSYLLSIGVTFEQIFLLAATIMVLSFFIAQKTIKPFTLPKKKNHLTFFKTIKLFWHKKAYRLIFIIKFILSHFYVNMTIFLPLFLRKVLLLDWDKIAIILPIMILPFLIDQIPLGRLADKRFGEKEILILGLIIIIGATGFISMLTVGVSWIVVAIVLFCTRIGASAIDVMAETYFFKNVDDSQSNFISIYRENYPLALLISPVITSILLSFNVITLTSLWLYIAVTILIFALPSAFLIKDTQ